MDLVKARERAKKKSREKESKPNGAPGTSPVKAEEERLVEETSSPSPSSPDREQKKSIPLPDLPGAETEETTRRANELPDDDVFMDTAFGEDLPFQEQREEAGLDSMIIGADDGEDEHAGHEQEIEEYSLEVSEKEFSRLEKAGAGSSKDQSVIKSDDSIPSRRADPVAKKPAKPALEGPARSEWVVGDSHSLSKVKMDWEDSSPTEGIAPEDDDFFSLVTEELYMREFGRGDEAESEQHLALLSFRLASETYAVPLTSIRQIIKMVPITTVPRVPGYVLGIISLRGTIIPIFDLRRVLKLPAAEPTRKTRIIIVTSGKYVAGLIVDEVEQVARIPESRIEPPPPVLGGVEADYIKGIGRVNKKMIILLYLDKIMVPVMTDRAQGA